MMRYHGLVGAAVAVLGLLGPARAAEPPLTSKSVPVQIRLAEAMAAHADTDEAIRRWIDILYYFGPSDADARAHFEIGARLLEQGRLGLATAQWRRALCLHPGDPEAARARAALQALGAPLPAGSPEAAPPRLAPDTPEDERQFVVAEADVEVGLLEFAIRDYLKVPNLYPRSARAPRARFQTGMCQLRLGRPQLALAQWRRLQHEFPNAPEAGEAAALMAAQETVRKAAGLPPAPAEQHGQRFTGLATGPDQGLSYAEDLYENGVTDYALQEYAKVLCDVYTPKGGGNPHRAYARYRMGVCASELGHPAAAFRQWRRLVAEAPDSPWRASAERALAACAAEEGAASSELAPALPEDLSSSLSSRFALAEQLRDCGLPQVASKEYLKVIHVVTAGRPNPRQAEALYLLGVCHQRLHRPQLAGATWEEVMARFPESPWAERARASRTHLEGTRQLLSAGPDRQEVVPQ